MPGLSLMSDSPGQEVAQDRVHLLGLDEEAITVMVTAMVSGVLRHRREFLVPERYLR